jgi:hypothetical protein
VQITFQGEPGYDAGGLLREFFAVMGREAFRPEARLFAPLSDESATCGVHPCPSRPKLKSKAKANDASSKGKDKEADHDSGGGGDQKKKTKTKKAKKEGSKRKGLLGWLGGGGGAKDDEAADVQQEKEALELYKAAGLFLAYASTTAFGGSTNNKTWRRGVVCRVQEDGVGRGGARLAAPGRCAVHPQLPQAAAGPPAALHRLANR